MWEASSMWVGKAKNYSYWQQKMVGQLSFFNKLPTLASQLLCPCEFLLIIHRPCFLFSFPRRSSDTMLQSLQHNQSGTIKTKIRASKSQQCQLILNLINRLGSKSSYQSFLVNSKILLRPKKAYVFASDLSCIETLKD